MQIILTGDFAQLPPVYKPENKASRQVEPPLPLFQTFEFKSLNMILLTTSQRQNGDSIFAALLDEVRVGLVTSDTVRLLQATSNNFNSNEDGINPTRLYATNAKVGSKNEDELLKLPGQKYSFKAKDFIPEAAASTHSQIKDLPLLSDCSWPRVFEVKLDAQVMLLKNIDVAAGFANGSRGVVVSIAKASTDQAASPPSGDTANLVIGVRFKNGEVKEIEQNSFEIRDGDECVIASRTQFPLRLAWAITIHKSQGQTLDALEVDLGDCFEYGQAYTALSRARSLDCIRVNNFSPGRVKCSAAVKSFLDNLTAASGSGSGGGGASVLSSSPPRSTSPLSPVSSSGGSMFSPSPEQRARAARNKELAVQRLKEKTQKEYGNGSTSKNWRCNRIILEEEGDL